MQFLRFLMSLFAALALLGTGRASAAETEFDWKSVCERSRSAAVPAQDRPAPEEAKGLRECSSEDLYYGIGRPADPAAARKCAYVELDMGDEKVFGGSSMLMTIYANGTGAARNYDLALKFACALGGAPAEMEGRIENLAKKKKEAWKGANFSLCDDITSGFMQGHCASHEERIAAAKRDAISAGLTGSWPEKDRKAFALLRRSLDSFIASRIENEVDLSGTGRSAFMIEEEKAIRDDFLASMKAFEHGSFPQFSAEQFTGADKEINAVYRKVQQARDPSWGTVTKDGIKRTQRTWLAYRDAWVAFGRQRYPAVSADSWKTWLTRKRTAMLKEFLGQ